MAYIVHFRGTGFTAPTEQNPKGIRVSASGELKIPGERPNSVWDVPNDVLTFAKEAFMAQTGCVRFKGDSPGGPGKCGVECFPTIRLGKAV